jgi:hydrogenase nickel incorporation protein HypA/HybF
MHELAVCKALVTQVTEIARRRAAPISAVFVGIGPLSGIEPHLLEQAYPFASVGTAAEGSRLMVALMPVRVRCRCCGAESTPPLNRLLCEVCGDWQTELLSGNEMLLQSVELDIPEKANGCCHV